MSNTYTLTSKIHQQLQRIAEEKGIEIKVKNENYIARNHDYGEWGLYTDYYMDLMSEEYSDKWEKILAIQEPQIRQILLALQEELGENPKYTEIDKEIKKWIDKGYFDYASTIARIRSLISESEAEALCQKWLDGLEPMFEREPETVLVELLEILKSI